MSWYITLLNQNQIDRTNTEQLIAFTRQILATLEQLTQDVLSYVSYEPQVATVVLRILNIRVQESQITPDLFTDFQDKQYCTKVTGEIQHQLNQAWQTIHPNEQASINNYVEILDQLTELVYFLNHYNLVHNYQESKNWLQNNQSNKLIQLLNRTQRIEITHYQTQIDQVEANVDLARWQRTYAHFAGKVEEAQALQQQHQYIVNQTFGNSLLLRRLNDKEFANAILQFPPIAVPPSDPTPEENSENHGPYQPKATIELLNGPNQGQQFTVQNEFIIGRGVTAILKLDNPHVSREHAVIKIHENQFFLQNRGRTGMIVNGDHIEAIRLHGDEIIQIEGFQMRFSL